MKPIIKISLITLIIIVIGLIIYFVWSALAPAPENPAPGSAGNLPTASSTSSSTSEQNQTSQPEQQNGSAVPTLEKISENPVFDFWVDSQTQEVYYLDPDGRIFSAKKGQDIQITQQKLNAPNFIKVSPNGQRVLMAFGAPRSPQWGIFDVIDGAWRPLPGDIQNAAWGTDSGNLIAFVKNGGSINLSNINISQNQPSYKIIAKDMRFEDVKMDFIPPDNMIIQENPSGDYAGRAWNLNLKNLSIYQLFSPQGGLTMKLSTDKNILFVFSADGGFRILNSANLNLTTPLPFSTLPSKCSPDSFLIYCFMPTDDGFKNSVLPDDYIKQGIYTSDILYRINPGTDEVLLIPLPKNAGTIDAQNPVASNGALYFINRYDKSLYSLSLE
ncbi:MAG: hypothetical protein ABSE68_00260 [Minisyncoccia bacterium]